MNSRPKRADDKALLEACAKGDAAAWEELIRRYRRLIYSIPHACRLPSDAADDIFQRVAILLFENVSRIERPEKLASWLTITTRRECWALSKEGTRTRGFAEGEMEAMPDEPLDVLKAVDQVRGEHALALAWERMVDPCRALLGALYLEDPKPSHAELAKRLGRPVGSLGPTHGRCLEKLRKLYVEQGGEAPLAAEALEKVKERRIGRAPSRSPGQPAKAGQ